jgi:ubiquinone/menaquinone biosynthesis C-methylase UbiE/DNA-binding transcriptional ArsR family regulator
MFISCAITFSRRASAVKHAAATIVAIGTANKNSLHASTLNTRKAKSPVTADQVSAEEWVTALKAAAEPTRLRILLLLAAGELSVKDLTVILGQSQPRLSRHLKLLAEAGLVDRFREGSWVYFFISDRTPAQRLAHRLISAVDQSSRSVMRDRERAEALKQEREAAAQIFFRDHAGDWDRIRALHVAESEVEAAMREAFGVGPFPLFVDLGTGTGRVLELFADRYDRAVGFDLNQAMLTYARSNLSARGLQGVQVRHGDIYNIALADGAANAVCMHQVLHFLSDPRRAVMEAARILAPGGRLLIVDFAPHTLEFLREREAHDRLGFSDALVQQWLQDAGLSARPARDLRPAIADGPDKLTVSVWLAERPAAIGRTQHNKTTTLLEETR